MCVAQNVVVKADQHIIVVSRTYFIIFHILYRLINVITGKLFIVNDETLKAGPNHLLYGML